MSTLNPYRAPFLDGNWIIDTANTIGVNHFQLKLISEIFEMFVLLINEINSHSFCFVSYLFSFYFTREVLPHRGLFHTIFCIAYLRICRGNLPREFAVGICRRNLPWEFAVAICRRFFVYISESFFVYLSKNLVYMEANLFYMCAKLFDLWDFLH